MYFISLNCDYKVEATTGEASLTGLSSLIIMLANAVGTKSIGDDAFWRILIKELLRFERGRYLQTFIYFPSNWRYIRSTHGH